MNRQRHKTKNSIYDAFTQLLSVKSYSRISVKEIIALADVGRSTFYDHFETKDDLARGICNRLFEHIFSDIVTACPTHNFAAAPDDMESKFAHILYHLRDNRRYYTGLIEYGNGALFLRCLQDFLLANVQINIAAKNGGSLASVPDDFLVSQICSGFIDALHWWYKQGLRSSPEQVASWLAAVSSPQIIQFKQKHP